MIMSDGEASKYRSWAGALSRCEKRSVRESAKSGALKPPTEIQSHRTAASYGRSVPWLWSRGGLVPQEETRETSVGIRGIGRAVRINSAAQTFKTTRGFVLEGG